MSTLAILAATVCSGQTYEDGNTHYPNDTIYIGTSPHTGGPVVTGPDREDGSWERVDCEKNPNGAKNCWKTHLMISEMGMEARPVRRASVRISRQRDKSTVRS